MLDDFSKKRDQIKYENFKNSHSETPRQSKKHIDRIYSLNKGLLIVIYKDNTLTIW